MIILKKEMDVSRLPIIIIQISVLVFSHLKHVTCNTRSERVVKSQQVATVTLTKDSFK